MLIITWYWRSKTVQVILECYTGRVAFSSGREANNLVCTFIITCTCMCVHNFILAQVDLTEEEREDDEAFSRAIDTKVSPIASVTVKDFLALINKSVKRVPSRRPKMCDVSFTFKSFTQL